MDCLLPYKPEAVCNLLFYASLLAEVASEEERSFVLIINDIRVSVSVSAD